MVNFDIKIFADTAELTLIERLAAEPFIAGVTTNPTLMRKAGVTDYLAFVKEASVAVGNKPISFEVFADEPQEMIRQARLLADYSPDIYVKIPVTNTKGQFMGDVIEKLSLWHVKVNVTAVFTMDQVKAILRCLDLRTPAIISVFAGRIADAGYDTEDILTRMGWKIHSLHPKAELLWASPRQLYDIYKAQKVGCDIITVAPDIISKFELIGCDLTDFSLQTVKMFYHDALKAGYQL